MSAEQYQHFCVTMMEECEQRARRAEHAGRGGWAAYWLWRAASWQRAAGRHTGLAWVRRRLGRRG